MKLLTSLLLLALSTSSLALNASSIIGTWSSGSGAVLTGPNGIASDPVNNTFTYPGLAGYSVSFTADGFYEEASITWTSNGTRPDCIQANLVWSHGTYVQNSSMITTSSEVFSGDGRSQVQNACSDDGSTLFYYTNDACVQTLS